MGMETKFLIDTDAEVSLIQIDKIRDDIYVKNEDKCELRGRSVGSLLTFGTCAADLIFKNKIMHHKFHLVRENISGRYDGILGQDFLRKYALQIKFFEEKPSQFVFMKESPALTSGEGESLSILANKEIKISKNPEILLLKTNQNIYNNQNKAEDQSGSFKDREVIELAQTDTGPHGVQERLAEVTGIAGDTGPRFVETKDRHFYRTGKNYFQSIAEKGRMGLSTGRFSSDKVELQENTEKLNWFPIDRGKSAE